MHCILVVDDDPGVRTMTSWALRAEGYTVHSAPDGSQGLAVMEREQPSVIVLDVQMPVMDGETFFKSIDGPGRPPVIIVSAFGAERICRELGAEGWIAKPFDPIELTALVAQFAPLS